jgi:hypothetical protein
MPIVLCRTSTHPHRQLSHAPGITKRGVKDHDAPTSRLFERHLISADTETPHRGKVLRRRKHRRRHLRRRADTEEVNRPHGVTEPPLIEGVGERLRRVASLPKPLDRGGMYPLEEENLDFFFGKRVAGHKNSADDDNFLAFPTIRNK